MAAIMSASSMGKAVATGATVKSQRSSKASAPRAVCASRASAFGGKQLKMQTRQQRQMAKFAVSATATKGIEKEVMQDEAPTTLLRDDVPDDSMRAKFEKMIRSAQDEICAAIEELDGGKFHEDAWTRPGGGGGISRVLQGGKVFEKAGINVSVVYGKMPPEAYRAATGESKKSDAFIPFFAAGISSVMHPHNPMAPTVHFNYRYFETEAPEGEEEGVPRAWWFGGGTDLTPSYVFEEDVKHFHQTQKDACDKTDEAFYPKFKQTCDDYFMIKHRGERRGVGGIFFDDMNDRAPEELLKLATNCAAAVVPAYVPLVEKHKDDDFTAEQKEWQQMRRGRYVEFNLVYDRGTTFGLKTGGRIESILMSLPLTARWEYDQKPEEGSMEAKALEAYRNPPDWLA
uniref:coproporphyrinogen oxidase n=1 Tax=Pyramimonas obovata TaxID=1411642 RepID=A0A7S0RW30_9CHLO|eukprot:CAMPEP_0118932068 /NCGR_PEP_ID=MMETSP1169-20130426/8993_1 /TAXON_ID=36882 /ORGANISM="Pyramimonas obovata, Strain CCMP722" /LENGTH=399 /DNA_ID=CAMNT_0006874665 /DNA_START=59 /DNA_END=1258 /DNA_ORIENTATION=+